ncbi:major facilitator superfamily transporter [Diaporthe amygdali]|uniref:major facilitator superfamily transporter n=1 Tax=Phomopsis amygdali TaxID=1214568 RepID=UPI0022FDE834|nr:major facilitator superfamily transporter [Diaporthe amygdali]KAJ0122687.1 major facilitator superfamily transporter [Diaporthe amygdali]
MDETTPLLPDAATAPIPRDDQLHRVPSKDFVDFDPNGDDENPIDWPQGYKWGIVTLLSFMAFTVTFTCISVVPIANTIVDDLDHGKAASSSSVLLVTIWELGEAAGPLLIAPLSELYGRYPVINIANTLFTAFTILAALSPSTGVLIVARALTGVATATNVLSPAIVGDIFISENRGTAMSLISLAPLIGGAAGPAIAGAVAQTLGWRKTLWMSAVLAGACEVAFLIFFRETYKVEILKRKAARLRRETGNLALKSEFDVDEGGHSWQLIGESVLRPLIVLKSSFVLQILALFGAFTFTYFYIMSTSLPPILQQYYDFTPAATGFAFLAFSIGSTVSVFMCNMYLDKVYIKLRNAHKGIGQPEYRLPFIIIGSILFPIPVLLYGWATQWHLHVSVLLFAVVLLGIFLMFSFLPLMAYVVDAFGLYSASAVSAVIVTRCLISQNLFTQIEIPSSIPDEMRGKYQNFAGRTFPVASH